MPDKPDLAALIGSRICHDLISPIGAIGNGVELLLLEGASHGPEVALISESVAHANARVRFFRVAFGAASTDQRISRREVIDILGGITRGGRIEVDWQGPSDIARSEVKLAFLLILCLETAMAQGGKISVTRPEDDWILSAEATRLRMQPDLWAVLTNPTAIADIGPAQVHFLLAQQEIARKQLHLAVEVAEKTVRFVF